MKCSECECLLRVKNKIGYNLYYCGYKKYGTLKALCGLYINNEEYRKNNKTCKYYKGVRKIIMLSDEEKAEEYYKYWCKSPKGGKQAYLDGLAEGRKENNENIKKIQEFRKIDQKQILEQMDTISELEKENEGLQEYRKSLVEDIKELQKENAELKGFKDIIDTIKAEGFENFCDVRSFLQHHKELEDENKILKKGIKIFNKNNTISFAGETIWKLQNPNSKMNCPNCVYIKVDNMFNEWLKQKEQEIN